MNCSNLAIGELAALMAALSWTLAALIYTSVGRRIGALATSLFRIVIACLLLVFYERTVCGTWLPTEVPAKTWLILGLSGFFWFFLSDLCLLKSYVLIGPRLALLIMSLSPPLAAMLSWVCLGDSLAFWRWTAMAMTLAGVAWVILERPEPSHAVAKQNHRKRGVFFAFLAAVLQAAAFMLSKAGVGECDAATATVISMFGALFGHLLIVTLWRRWPAMLEAMQKKRALLALSVAAVIGPFFGVICSMAALNYAPTGVVATTIATMPILILPFNFFIYRERISWRVVGGAAVTIAGVAILSM